MKMWRKYNLSFENSLPLPLSLSLSLARPSFPPLARLPHCPGGWMHTSWLGGLGQTNGRTRKECANATTASLPSCQRGGDVLRMSAWRWEGVPQKQTYWLYLYALAK